MLFPPVRRVSFADLKVAGAYLLGTTVGSIATAVLLWAFSGMASILPAMLRGGLLAVGCALVVATDMKLLGDLSLPANRRQIPPEVIVGRRLAGAFQFGFEVGTGVRTQLPTGAPHVLALYVLLGAPTLRDVLALAVAFGFGRGVQQLATATVENRDSFQEGWQQTVSAMMKIAPAATVVGVAVAMLRGL